MNSRREITLIGRSALVLPNGFQLEPRDYGATLLIVKGVKQYLLRPHETDDPRNAKMIDVTEFVGAGHFLVVDAQASK
jgi:hypothetical protein